MAAKHGGSQVAGGRARNLGFVAPRLPTGRDDAITDVGDVRVGHTTLIEGEGPPRACEGPVRTGVTVILPHGGDLFLAVIESVEEAVLNALCAAETMTGRDGHRLEALPVTGLAARIARLEAGGEA